MKKIVFEWKTRVVDFTTKEEAENYARYMRKNYKICKEEITPVDNEEFKWSLQISYTTYNSKYNCGF